jgi:hypothetical protein
MLQTLRADSKAATRPGSRLPASVLWENPEINFIDISDVTGGYEPAPGGLVFLDQFLDSIVQATYHGTGGQRLWGGTIQSIIPASGAYIVVQSAPRIATKVDPAAATPLDVSRQLSFVRHHLSLNTTDLSRILLVERPTVYAWLDGKWAPKDENKSRIRKLYQVARTWQEISKEPVGKLLREPIEGDASLFDHLVHNSLEVAAINRVLELIGEMAERTRKDKRARSVREIARLRGFKPLPSSQEDERFDQITRF